MTLQQQAAIALGQCRLMLDRMEDAEADAISADLLKYRARIEALSNPVPVACISEYREAAQIGGR